VRLYLCMFVRITPNRCPGYDNVIQQRHTLEKALVTMAAARFAQSELLSHAMPRHIAVMRVIDLSGTRGWLGLRPILYG
jgi:hypothetical protein